MAALGESGHSSYGGKVARKASSCGVADRVRSYGISQKQYV